MLSAGTVTPDTRGLPTTVRAFMVRVYCFARDRRGCLVACPYLYVHVQEVACPPVTGEPVPGFTSWLRLLNAPAGEASSGGTLARPGVVVFDHTRGKLILLVRCYFVSSTSS